MLEVLYNNPCFSKHTGDNDNHYQDNQKMNFNCYNTSCGYSYKFLLGTAGPTGPTVATGSTGPQGIQGVSGSVLSFADFYALMPHDNAATVAPGTDVSFSHDGPNSGTSITRTEVSSFNLLEIGTYEIYFNAPVSEAGQLQLMLNGAPLANTVIGRATGTSDISGMFLVETTSINSVLTVRNPAALTITPLAGGTNPVSAHLAILQIQ